MHSTERAAETWLSALANESIEISKPSFEAFATAASSKRLDHAGTNPGCLPAFVDLLHVVVEAIDAPRRRARFDLAALPIDRDAVVHRKLD